MLQRIACALALSFTLPLYGGEYVVTSTADDGPGTLRAGLTAANSGECRPCAILFDLPPPVPDTGYFTIRPLSPLPVIIADDLRIDGFSQATATGDTNPHGPEIELDGTAAGYRSGIKVGRSVILSIRGLAINRFEGHGILVDHSSQVTIAGCHVGVDPTASRSLPNGLDGIAVTTTAGLRVEGNVIGGNHGNGLYIAGFFDMYITANRIGLGRDGVALPNGANGIDINARDVYVQGNTVANNAHYGVVISDHAGRIDLTNNALYQNGLMNLGLGHDASDPADPLDADSGANGRLNAPVLTSARARATLPGFYIGEVEYSGTIQTKPNQYVIINAYASPTVGRFGFAEARKWIGGQQVLTDANGRADFSLERNYGNTDEILLVPGGFLAVTASTDEGTSELSPPIAIAADVIAVTTTEDEGAGSLRDALGRANRSLCSSDAPCWVTFDIPESLLTDGVALFEPRSPLPVITNSFVHIDGSSQRWLHGDTNPHSVEVEIRGQGAGPAAGLVIGSEESKIQQTFVHEVAITGFAGDGIMVQATDPAFDVRLSGLLIGIEPGSGAARGNGGNGISIRGRRSGGPATQWTVRDSVVGGNAGHGIVVDGSGVNVRQSWVGLLPDGSPRGNGASGIHVAWGIDDALTDNAISFNGGDGVSTEGDAQAVFIRSLFYANGGLGIDRNDDGLGGGAAEGVTPRPTIVTAVFNAERNATIVAGNFGVGQPTLPIYGGSGNEMQLVFYTNTSPDSSGFGEGEAYAPGRYVTPSVNGSAFQIELPGDLRGEFVTATATYAVCFWEFGCHGRDTSELSNAVEVE